MSQELSPQKEFSHRTLGQCASLAIELECTAIKLGNVHPYAAFLEMNHASFLSASRAIGNAIDQSMGDRGPSVGRLVHHSTSAMMQAAGCNTSLGTILLFAPLLVAAFREGHREIDSSHVAKTLSEMSAADSKLVYESIALANPGGLGTSDRMDLSNTPPSCLLEAMSYASGVDDVALQYASGFELVFQMEERLVHYHRISGNSILDAIRDLQLELLATRKDSLIRRKGGDLLADEVRERASCLYRLRFENDPVWWDAWNELDRWMRQQVDARGKRIANPGTTADLIAAALLVCILHQADGDG